MADQGPERRSGKDRRQKDRRHRERRQYQRRSKGEGKPFFEVVPGRRKKSDRRTGVDRRKAERRETVRREADIRAIKEKLELRNGMYYVREGAGPSGGPYCTRCLDVERKLVPVERNIELSRSLVTSICPRCGAIY